MLSRRSKNQKSDGAISSPNEHRDFDERLTILERKAREQAEKLKRIEIELGIFRPDTQIMDEQ